jgi:hypothetical protein
MTYDVGAQQVFDPSPDLLSVVYQTCTGRLSKDQASTGLRHHPRLRQLVCRVQRAVDRSRMPLVLTKRHLDVSAANLSKKSSCTSLEVLVQINIQGEHAAFTSVSSSRNSRRRG